MNLYRFLSLVPLAFVGCEFLQRIAEAPPEAVEPIGEGINDVVTQPANPIAWWKLVVAVVGLIAIGLGSKKAAPLVAAKVAKKAAKKAKS